MKSDFRICLRQQNLYHRRVDPLRNRRLVRIESHHSKPFLPEKSRYFERFRKYEKNGRATLKKRLSLRPMAQTTVACHFRVSIGASLEFSASLIIEKFHSDRTFVLLPSGCFGRALAPALALALALAPAPAPAPAHALAPALAPAPASALAPALAPALSRTE